MMYKKYERTTPACLECGEKIRYGRSDKKFCCDTCRNTHYNKMARSGRFFRRRIIAVLNRNYAILEEMLREGRLSAGIAELAEIGFTPNMVTSVSKCRKHTEYSCFDIRYVMTETRIHSITKKSLPLQAGTKMTY